MTKSKISGKKLIKTFFTKYYGGYVLLFGAIAVFEMAMLVFRLVEPGFAGQINDAHVLIDCAIIAISVACEIILLIKLKTKELSVLGITAVYVFCALFICCAAGKSYLDMKCGYSGAFFLVSIIVVAGMFVINPYIYSFMVCVPAVALVVACVAGRFRLFAENPAYICYLVMFVVVSILVCYRHYSLACYEIENVERLEALSSTDRLTGLGNRLAFDIAMEEAERTSTPFSMAIVDIDDYKNINDAYGHAFGDECLKTIADELREEFETGVYRYGGDEIVVLFGGGSKELIEKLRNVNERLAKNERCRLRLSGGVYTPDRDDADIFKKVDEALYYAKSNKKGEFIEYDRLINGCADE